jgi:D-lactate dehydrogenase
MKVAVFSTKNYDRRFLTAANNPTRHELQFFEPQLSDETAALAAGSQAVCVFVNDRVNASVIAKLSGFSVCLIALRCAGYNNVDLKAAANHRIVVVRVPAYSPYAVAEHTVCLILALNRKIHRAYNRTREGNFSLEGMLGFDLHAKTVGIVGTGTIGSALARILLGFGCRVVAFDPYPNDELRSSDIEYLTFEALLEISDIISLHCPLTPENKRMIDARALERMKPGAMLINTSRGALIDTASAITALKSGKLGHLGLDVYEEEEKLFFEDRSGLIIPDDVFSRLLTFPNVIITGHQAFFTREAMESISVTTIDNISRFDRGEGSPNEVVA